MAWDVAFGLKKFIGSLLMPLPLSFVLMALGLLLIVFGRRVRGYLALLVGIAIIVLCSFQPVVVAMAKPLETRYVKFLPERHPHIDYVVVMGGSHASDAHLPESDLLSSVSVKRLMEGIRVQRFYPNSRLVFSGYAIGRDYSHAEAMRRAAVAMGVSPQRIMVNPAPRDSAEEVASLQRIVGAKSFALVTSAAHMHRVVLEFERLGLTPVPAPTAYVWRSEGYSWRPHGGWLQAATGLWHEYLGLLWMDIREWWR